MPDENLNTEQQREDTAKHADASHPAAPINTGESISERIARIKREEAQRSGGESGTTGNVESSNTSSTAGSADRDAADPQRAASTQHVRSDASVAAGSTTLRGQGPSGQAAEGTKHDQASEALGSSVGRVQDGTKTGERVRATSTSVVPESNDVMLGDQSSRKDGAKDTTNALPVTEVDKLQTDGSTSPHDASSEGGSRQAQAHQQLREAVQGKTEADDQPAFRAEAKARTI